ncbi:MAG: 2-hydroxyacyl-CoA dehydratase [Thermodesulfobacteriota bacterium]|nr:2-hydroxyacyl-CoA dehydratase [Thermodesulfobacteriota bacterium]
MNQSKEKTTAVKATTASKRVRPFVKDIYARALEAKEQGKPIAYCMVASQYEEILQAMDIVSIWTENYGGLCAAKRDAERFLVKAEADGFSNNICGYVRNGLGFEALRQELGEMPPDAPDGGMAKPTMLLGSSAVCDPRYKWYQALGRYLDAPVYAHDIVHPPIDADLKEVKPYYIKYQTEQFRGLVDFLVTRTGSRLGITFPVPVFGEPASRIS